jgi:hypothetical protein
LPAPVALAALLALLVAVAAARPEEGPTVDEFKSLAQKMVL